MPVAGGNLSTKLTLPPARSGVPRPRLREALSRGLGGKLILVSAPAGFGKSTLVAEWIRATGVPAAWLTLDAADNDVSRFLSYLSKALSPLLPRASSVMRHLVAEPFPSDVDAIMTALATEATARPDLVLVLDDYHHVSDPTIHAAVGYFVERMPPHLHLLIATRADPPLPLARLRASGELTEIRAADLRFTREESAAFFAAASVVRLSDDQIAALSQRTEGWIAGMRLAATSLRGREDVVTFVRDFSGSNRYILDYLSEEVMGGLADSDQSFLVRTSILDRFCASVCDAVTGGLDSQSILERMESANIFIEPLDDTRVWYRYHPLFADMLHARLARMPAAEIAVLHRRASGWFEARGMEGEATGHALKAGDFGRAADLALASAEEALMHCESAALLRWTDAIPASERAARPLLCVYRACAMLQLGKPAPGIEECLDEAESGRVDAQPGPEIAAIRSYLAFLADDPEKSIALANPAIERLSVDRRFLRSTLGGLVGVVSQEAGDLATAADAFGRSRDEALKIGNHFTSTVMQWRLAQLALMRGALGEAERLCVEGFPFAVEDEARPLPVLSFLILLLAEVHLERNELDEAEARLREARGPALAWTGVRTEETMLEFLRIAAFLGHARGDTAAVLAALHEARDLSLALHATDIEQRVIETAFAELHLNGGELGDARLWAERYGAPAAAEARRAGRDGRPYHFLRDAELMLYARLLLAEGDPQQALSLITALLPDATARGLGGIELHGLLVECAAEDRLGKAQDASITLRRALRLAAPQKRLRPFLDMANEITPLLREARDLAELGRFVDEILAAVAGGRGARLAPLSSAAQQPLGALSSREIAIVRLLAEGLTNKEIAAQSFISEETVKWHASNIYGKLGVRNRTEAVARARALGILAGE